MPPPSLTQQQSEKARRDGEMAAQSRSGGLVNKRVNSRQQEAVHQRRQRKQKTSIGEMKDWKRQNESDASHTTLILTSCT